jgi:hypothetical protein
MSLAKQVLPFTSVALQRFVRGGLDLFRRVRRHSRGFVTFQTYQGALSSTWFGRAALKHRRRPKVR